MADEYISREAAYNAIVNNYTTDDQLQDLYAIPAADVAEVRHGRWLSREPAPWWSWYATCSVCGEQQTLDRRYTNYCPNCGAKMDERSEGDV